MHEYLERLEEQQKKADEAQRKAREEAQRKAREEEARKARAEQQSLSETRSNQSIRDLTRRTIDKTV